MSIAANGVATIALNRPKAYNAMNEDMHEAIAVVMRRLGQDSTVKAAVITGRGEYYSSGADFGSMMTQMPTQSSESTAQYVENMFVPYIDFAKPLICAMNGPSIGESVALSFSCSCLARFYALLYPHMKLTPFLFVVDLSQGMA